MRAVGQYLAASAGVVLLIAAALALTGCAEGPHVDTPRPPAHVDLPVVSLCVTKDQLASHPEPAHVALSGDAQRDSEALAAADLRLRVWGRELAALVQGCVG